MKGIAQVIKKTDDCFDSKDGKNIRFRKWEVTVDGTTYNKYVKAEYDKLMFTEGDEISFEVNDKGTMKNIEVTEGEKLEHSGPHQKEDYQPAINQQKQTSIERQSCLKVAMDYIITFYGDKKIQPEDVCKCADYFLYYVQEGKYPEQPETSEEVEDLPF